MTEEIAATPGWVEERLDGIFAELPEQTQAARAAYVSCLAGRKSPASPSDLLGAEFEPCRPVLLQALLGAGVERARIERIEHALEALEAEITSDS